MFLSKDVVAVLYFNSGCTEVPQERFPRGDTSSLLYKACNQQQLPESVPAHLKAKGTLQCCWKTHSDQWKESLQFQRTPTFDCSMHPRAKVNMLKLGLKDKSVSGNQL